MRLRRSRWIHMLLLTALVGAQWLALVHGWLHGRGLPGGGAPVAVVAEGPHASATAWLEHLFAGHHHDSDCRLYDQAASGDQVPLALSPALPAEMAPAVVPRWVQRAWAARLTPQFRARAPPALA